MKNQKGVTLVELLVTVLIMTVILSVITSLVNVALQSEREVTIKNELQREARFMIEQVTEKMRDGNTASFDSGTNLVSFSDGNVLSVGSNVVIDGNSYIRETSEINVYDVHLVLIHSYKNMEYELNTEMVIADRFRY